MALSSWTGGDRSDWANRMENMMRRMENAFGLTGGLGDLGGMQMALPTTTAMDILPPIDVADEDRQVVVQAELPGVEKKDIDVRVEGNTLIISGQIRRSREYSERRWKIRERSYGKFERRVGLPRDVDPNKVNARYDNGVLEITVGKTAEQPSQARRIAIQ